MTEERWDVFVSYASEDREAVVRPLAEQLEHCGLAVWYDQTQLRVGDSIRRKIDEGLARARYGVVILSPSFFDKHYPEQELDGLAQREQDGAKVILPVWYEVAEKDVRRHSAWLAGRLAAKWEDGIAVVIEQLLGAIAAEDDQQATQLRTDRAIGPQHPAQRRQLKTGQKWEPLAALLPDLEALADGLGEELKGTAPPSTVARNHATILKVAAILEARHIEGPPTGQPVGNAAQQERLREWLTFSSNLAAKIQTDDYAALPTLYRDVRNALEQHREAWDPDRLLRRYLEEQEPE
ncbi:MAG: toll/interleukin-1 receptor domain-containing protein [Gemmatimonadota bacterium]|nr:toll/interleukin-1 receptor domain-containing protein [Gemmatimonadota bacterium]